MNYKKLYSQKISCLTVLIVVLSLLFLIPHYYTTQKNESIKCEASSINLDSNLELKDFLIDLNNNNDLTTDCFSSVTQLQFSNTNSLADNIISIDGIEQFNWTSLTSISFSNLTHLNSINLYGLKNLNSLFPNLNTIIIDSNFSLNTVNLDKNNNITNLTITNNPNIENMVLPSLTNCTNIEISWLNLDNTFTMVGAYDKLNSVIIENCSSILNIDLSNAKILTNVKLINLNEFKNLRLEKAILLTEIQLTNCPKLESVIIPESEKLKYFTFDEENSANNKLNSSKLKVFIIKNNLWIDNLDISSTEQLESIDLYMCQNINEIKLNSNLTNVISINLYDLHNLTSILNLENCTKIQILNLYNCKLLNDSVFNYINIYTNLTYLNIKSTTLTNIELNDKLLLQTLLISENEHLNTLYLENIPKITDLSTKNCRNLKTVSIKNLPNLTNIDFINSIALETILLNSTKIETFILDNFSYINSIELIYDTSLKKLSISNCFALSKLEFSNSVNLEELSIINCQNLDSKTSQEFIELTNLNKIVLDNCNMINEITIQNCAGIKEINLSNMTEISYLKLYKLGGTTSSFNIFLPLEYNNLKTLILDDMPNAIFSTTSIIHNSGKVNRLYLNNIAIKNLDFSNNAIISISLKKLSKLESINLSNNNLSNFTDLLTDLESMNKLTYCNLNGNRLDFSDKENYNLLNASYVKEFIVIGVQNMINGNSYTFYPSVYIGEFENNIELIVYRSNTVIKKPNIDNIDENNFYTINYTKLNKLTLESGTYIFKYYKNSATGLNPIVIGDPDYNKYLTMYCTVTKETPWISYVWIIFICIACAVFLFVIVSFVVDKLIYKKRLFKKSNQDEQDELSYLSNKQLSSDNNFDYKNDEKIDNENDDEYKNEKLTKKEINKRQKELVKLANKERKKAEKELKKQKKNKNSDNQAETNDFSDTNINQDDIIKPIPTVPKITPTINKPNINQQPIHQSNHGQKSTQSPIIPPKLNTNNTQKTVIPPKNTTDSNSNNKQTTNIPKAPKIPLKPNKL